MTSKRSSEAASCETAEKIPKLIDFDYEETPENQIKKLIRALDEEKDEHSILLLAQNIAQTSELPQILTMRLLEFRVHIKSDSLAAQLLKYQPVALNTNEGGKLLWTAVNYKTTEIAALLIKHGADLSVRKYYDNRTLLHEVVNSKWNERKEKLLKLLLDHGADANSCNSDGHTPLRTLMTSTFSRNDYCSSTRWIKILLDYGIPINLNDEDRFDDICLVCDTKPELLLRFVGHQNPDEDTRNQRGVRAIDYLISRKYVGVKSTAAMRLIKKVLDLGVPVNLTHRNGKIRGKPRLNSFLNSALHHKNEKAIEALLQCGADPHFEYIRGRNSYTPLYQATAFKCTTTASRMLINSGASIYDRSRDGVYPIHGACKHESLQHIHLFLNLGADLNCTDNFGTTPFQCMKMKKETNINKAHYLVIKHFALISATNEIISENDMTKIFQFEKSKNYFEKCMAELERMKTEKVYADVSYFSLLSLNMKSMVQLMKDTNVVKRFDENKKKRAVLFPEYFYMLLYSVEAAKKNLEILLTEKEKLRKAIKKFWPDHIIENITYYYIYDKILQCQTDFYMNLHASLTNTKADKAKIM